MNLLLQINFYLQYPLTINQGNENIIINSFTFNQIYPLEVLVPV